jgi:hypothetical protein
MSINELISSLGKGDNVSANKVFASVMANKISKALDAQKIKIAGSLGKTPVDSDKTLDQE